MPFRLYCWARMMNLPASKWGMRPTTGWEGQSASSTDKGVYLQARQPGCCPCYTTEWEKPTLASCSLTSTRLVRVHAHTLMQLLKCNKVFKQTPRNQPFPMHSGYWWTQMQTCLKPWETHSDSLKTFSWIMFYPPYYNWESWCLTPLSLELG